ncbi:RSP_7527 family protein [Fodinicurvata halophila]|uniref:RSP_7527 family protein n=1 Tax=Fodinicurvata halophila TaxID=1419723 RepID=A0ABV8UFF7_9PROT
MTRLTEVELAELNRAKVLSQPMNVQQIVEQAHRLRAQATADMIAKAARGLRRTLRLNQLGTYITRQTLYARTYRELSQLSDRSLADIGITRSEIDSVARELTQTGSQATETGAKGFFSTLREKLAQARMRQQTRRRISELDARMLQDIGINPHDNIDAAIERIISEREANRTAAQADAAANARTPIVEEKLRTDLTRALQPAANQPVENAKAA